MYPGLSLNLSHMVFVDFRDVLNVENGYMTTHDIYDSILGRLDTCTAGSWR